MKLNWIILVCAAVTLVFSLGYIFLPAQILALLGYHPDSFGLLAVQFLGAISMGYVASIWSVRNASREVQRPVLVSALTAMGFAFGVSLMNQVMGTLGALGWLGVVMFGLGFLIFAYFYWLKK